MRILLQIVVMVALIGGLLWYVGIEALITTLSNLKLEFLALAFLAYFGIKRRYTWAIRLLSNAGLS